MSGCCAADGAQSRPHGVCPSCGYKAKPVPTVTVKNLVIDHKRVRADHSYSFCRTAECDVVYFSETVIFRKRDLKVRVGLKEHQDPVPLCYCFGYDREQIRQDIEQRGTSDIPDRIKTEVQDGFCACEVKNPSGACCLGEMNRAIKEAYEAIAART
jgi:hypothetical protein